MKRGKTFLLAGHGGCYNRGCEAIIRTTMMMIRDEFKDPFILLSSFDHINDARIDLGQNVRVVPARLTEAWKRGTWPWSVRQICKLFSGERSLLLEYLPIIKAVKKADMVLSVGGDNYSMDYGLPTYYFELNKLVKKAGKKLVIWAASIGPFSDDGKIKDIVANLNLADLITIRESVTMRYLQQIGVTAKIKQTADPAFLLPAQIVNTEKFLAENQNDILGVNISPILSKYTTNKNNIQIMQEIKLFVNKIIKDMGLRVLLIPHVTKNTGLNNDYSFMAGVYDGFKDTGMIGIASANYNAMQMKYIISQCRFFIGARTHATIASLSSGVPTLSIGYSLKSKGINEDIFGHNDFVIDIKDLSSEFLLNKFMKLYTEENKIKNILLTKIPKFKELANKNVEYLKEVLNKI